MVFSMALEFWLHADNAKSLIQSLSPMWERE
uniref:Uncharacterized protein n=1 Tax=Rhizophora mucronata TaxID=61149 RepID=A0A2P2NJ53_RHIMU